MVSMKMMMRTTRYNTSHLCHCYCPSTHCPPRLPCCPPRPSTSRLCMVTDLNDAYKMMMMMMMTIVMIEMIRMMKTKNGHNSASFEDTTSRFYMLIDLNDIYGMVIMMKTQIAITQPILKVQHLYFAW